MMRNITQRLLLTCLLLFAGHLMMAQCDSANYDPLSCETQETAYEPVSQNAMFENNLATASNTFYMRSNVGNPWGQTTNQTAMNTAFGAGNWTEVFFETADPASIFSTSSRFVFMEGSDTNASELNAFLTANLTLIENWVAEGKTLFLNAAPNEGANINFGFGGSTLVYDAGFTNSTSVTVVDTNHPAFLGPNLPVASVMTGGSYAHSHITGTGFTDVLVNSTDPAIFPLREKAWGSGTVMMGGMTTTNYHSPAIESFNIRANLLVYLESLAFSIACPSDIVVNNAPGTCGATVTFPDATATDSNGDPLAVTQTAGPASGSVFPVGDTLIEFSADDNGTIITCSFMVTVEDTEAPTVDCPLDITVSSDSGLCGAVVNYATQGDFYSTNNDGTTLIRINPVTGDVTPIGSFGYSGTWALTFTPTGDAYTIINGFGSAQLASVDIATGTATPIGSPLGFTAITVESDSQGVLYTVGYGTQNLYTIDPATGAASLIGATGLPSTMDISFDNTDKLWAINTTGTLFSINTTNGQTTTEATFSGGLSDEMGMAISPSGTFYLTEFTGSSRLFTLDPATGVTTFVSNISAMMPHGGDFLSNFFPTADNCPDVTITQTAGLASGSFFPVGTTTNIFEVTDAAGNTITCSFDVTVEDNEAPTAMCVAPFNLALDANGEASLTAQMLDNGSTDNCNDLTFTFSETFTAFAEVAENQNLTITLPAGAVVENVDFASYGTPNGSNGNYTIGGCHALNSQSIVESYALGNNTFTIPATNGVFGDPCNGTPKRLYVTVSYSTEDTELTFSCVDLGDTTVTLTVTDASGNSATCTTVVTVIDDLSPEITCVADQTVDADAGFCSYTHSGTAWDALATDNCSIATTTYELTGVTTGTGTTLDGVTFNLGETTVTWTTTDGSTNTADCSFTVMVEDNEAPVIVCVSNQTMDTNAGVCTYTHSGIAWDATATDNCSSATITYVLTGATTGTGTTLDGVVFNLGETTVSWTATDDVANSVVCSFTITVEDNEAPIISCTDSIGTGAGSVLLFTDASVGTNQLLEALTNGGYDVTFTTDNLVFQTEIAIPDAYDAAFYFAQNMAPDATSVNLLAAFAATGNKVMYFDWTRNNTYAALFDYSYTGSSNNTQVTVTDAELAAALPSNPFTLTNPGWGVFSTGMNPQGTTQVLATFGDGTGAILSNAARTVFIYGFVADAIPFTDLFSNNAEVLLGGSVSTDPGVCTYTHAGTDWDATATDNCSIATLEYELTGATTGTGSTLDGVAFNLGETTVTWTATDDSDNTTVCSYTVTVEDNEAPVIACIANQTVDTDTGVCTYTHSGNAWDATATDNCSIATTVYELTGATTGTGTTLDGVGFNLGETTVTWTTTDGSGNTNTCNYTVTVEDNEAPAITCVTDQTIDTDAGVCTYTHSGTAWDATATDNCSVDTITYELTGVTTGTGTSLDGVTFNLGETTVTWTATDGSTNTDVCSFTVTVEDNEVPVITCITNQTIDTDAGVCTYTHSGIAWDATATDNCSVDSITYELTGVTTGTGTSLAGVTFNIGETTVIWTATDGSTNTDVCSYTVTVEDNEVPIAMCVAPFTIQLDANGEAGITVADIDMGSTDNCGIDTITISQSDFDCSHVGDNTITLTVTDANGNISTCTTVVTVEDTVAPDAICAAPFTVQLDFFGNASITVADIDNGSSDACGIASMSIEPSEFTCADIGDNVVTLTVTDNNGNVSTCTTIVTIEDTLAPQIVCPNDIVIDTEPGSCEATVFFAAASAFDNCEGFIATTQTAGPPSGSTFPIGVTTITFSATDASGNTSTCDFTITVVDNQAPVAVCQDITITLDADGLASITAEDLDGGSTDNCGSALTYTASQTDFDCSHVGGNTITLTVTDVEGNESTCTAIVTVEDTTAPIAECVAPFTIQLDADGTASITAADIDNGSTDICGVDSITLSQSEFTCADLGDNEITLTVTDPSGNESTCTTVVTVEDTINPTVACLDFTLELGPDGTALLTPEDIGGTSTDNCDITITAIDIEEFDCDDIGTPVLVTYFASDASGNIASCTAMVTVVDNAAPVIECPADQTVDTDPDSITYTVPDYFGEGLAIVTDNCTEPVTILGQDPAPGTLLLDGTYTVTLTAEDEYGNESSCEFELTVDTILGAGDRTDFSSLTMYPNPAEYTVTIGNPQFIAIDKVAVYDIQGRLVMEINTRGATGNQTLDVSELSSAVYMVVIESNGKQSVKRLIRK